MRKIHRKGQNISPETSIVGPMLAPIWHPFGANATTFCDMALGTCPWVPQGVILMVFWLDGGAILVTFGTYLAWIFDRMSIDSDSYFTFLGNASH